MVSPAHPQAVRLTVLEVQVCTTLEIYSCSPSFSGEATFTSWWYCHLS